MRKGRGNAAAISAIVFGVAHAHQGFKKGAIVTGIAALCQLLVYWNGGLALAMLVHAGYDIAAGLSYGRLLEQRDASRRS